MTVYITKNALWRTTFYIESDGSVAISQEENTGKTEKDIVALSETDMAKLIQTYTEAQKKRNGSSKKPT